MADRLLPDYPLFVKNPNFSIWCNSEHLNSCSPKSWWGESKPMYGFVKSHGKTYCFLGETSRFQKFGVLAASQTKLNVSAFTTDYEFVTEEFTLKLRFVSPLHPQDLHILSLPVCYMEYEIEGDSNAELSFFVNRRIAYNDIPENTDKRVRGGNLCCNQFECAFLGLSRQMPISSTGDMIGADWGYFYLSGEKASVMDESDLLAYITTGTWGFENPGEERYLGSVNKGNTGVIMLGYDDIVSIDYFGIFLKDYYLQNHTILEALSDTYANRTYINQDLARMDADIVRRAAPFGKDYLLILYASLRQSIAAHKLVQDINGDILFLSKECWSNGCIATVDVTYPSSPLYLLYNPELLKGMLRPILKFARMPVWKYDFAPHDAGTYPSCCGQIYAIRQDAQFRPLSDHENHQTHFPYYLMPSNADIYDLAYQMPVEECANMILLFLACYQADKDISFYRSNRDLAQKWADYLVKHGAHPGNQLCTDDFAGHLEKNVNLSIKAVVAIASYAELEKQCGNQTAWEEYRRRAEQFASELCALGENRDHLPLTWDSDDRTYSLKYNLFFDKVLHLNLFHQDILEDEVSFYLDKADKYGIPLDNRENYTKSDWLMWVAALTYIPARREKIFHMVANYLRETPERVPFGDWYDCTSAHMICFRARSVQGGCFAPLLCSECTPI